MHSTKLDLLQTHEDMDCVKEFLVEAIHNKHEYNYLREKLNDMKECTSNQSDVMCKALPPTDHHGYIYFNMTSCLLIVASEYKT